jgi:exopolysaccharide biosynthesis polyprenyl glycosylphosphotransferase
MNGSSIVSTSQEPVGRNLFHVGLDVAESSKAATHPQVHISRKSLYFVLKRGFDVLASLTALVLLSPLFLATAILIKLRDGGPILFIQKRIGKDGRVFDFYKFRSMVMGAERMRAELEAHNQHKSGVTFKIKNDPRITWIGRIIRKTSIDELPQFLNILRGDMSLVGPRPPLPTEVEQYTPHDWQRLLVTPGLTCYWQIQGRAEIPFEQQVELDLKYIREQSMLTDLRILLATLPAVLSGRGAY